MGRMAMQVVTWGTIVGAVISALVLAALDRSPHNYSAGVTLAQAWQALNEAPAQPASARQFGSRPAAAPAHAASAPSLARP